MVTVVVDDVVVVGVVVVTVVVLVVVVGVVWTVVEVSSSVPQAKSEMRRKIGFIACSFLAFKCTTILGVVVCYLLDIFPLVPV